MNVLRLAAVMAVTVALLTACAGSRPGWTPAPTTAARTAVASAMPLVTAAPTTAATPAPTAAPAARVIVTLDDTMRIAPATMTVRAGQPVTFVVTNSGKIPHEFTLGDADVQDEHEQEMLEMGGMGMTADEDNAIAVAPGQTKELVFTFETPGMSLAGCHVMGHYPAGMKAAIAVV